MATRTGIIDMHRIRLAEVAIVEALTISELEKASGVPRSTIHYYIRHGLLPQPQKTAGTRSLYSADYVVLLRRIAEAKADGRSLLEIRADLQTTLTRLSENPVDLEAREYQRTHQAILRLATKEFVRRGYRGTRLADLIRKSGISSSVFYGHFPSKRQLWAECFCTLVEWSNEYLEPRLAESVDMVERLLARTAAGLSLHGLSLDLLALLDADGLETHGGALKPVEEAERSINRNIAAELAAMRDPAGEPSPIPDEVLAYSLNMAFHSALTRVARDSGFSLLDFVRTNVWLWLAVRAAMTGRVNVNAELAEYEDRIRELVATPPPVFPGLED
jgi:AcrR family transcriptional regulator